jgi:hypothetical protein
MGLTVRVLGVTLLLAASATIAGAVDVPVTGLKLIIVDKTASAASAKAVFVAKDAGVTKGAGTDTADIVAELGVSYDTTSGVFSMPQGANWLVNKPTVAKFVNTAAPGGGSNVKVSVVKPGKLVKVVAKGLGDVPIDISTPPTGSVYVSHLLFNGDDINRHCTSFGTCSHKLIAGGTGYKLVCKGGSTGDPDCLGSGPGACCNLTDPATLCGFTPSVLACQQAGGTPGGAGTSCDSSTGTCLALANAGPCCDGYPSPFGTLCLAAPVLIEDSCPGNFSASALCSPDGSCS